MGIVEDQKGSKIGKNIAVKANQDNMAGATTNTTNNNNNNNNNNNSINVFNDITSIVIDLVEDTMVNVQEKEKENCGKQGPEKIINTVSSSQVEEEGEGDFYNDVDVDDEMDFASKLGKFVQNEINDADQPKYTALFATMAASMMLAEDIALNEIQDEKIVSQMFENLLVKEDEKDKNKKIEK